MPKGREGHARVAVLTVIPEEMAEVMDALVAHEPVGDTGAFTSEAALSEGLNDLPFIVLRCTDRSNGPAADSARDLMESWRPETIMLVGIAGGIRRLAKDAETPRLEPGPELGDVVVANMIHFGDYGKDLPQGFIPRWLPLVHPPAGLIMRHCERLRVSGDWGAAIENWPGATPPRLHIGEVIAVEAVAGNPRSGRQQAILQHFDKALAIDMESKGVAAALHAYEADVGVHYHPRWLCIRGISDLVVGSAEAQEIVGENQSQRESWRVAAARSAAVVAREVLRGLLRRTTPAHPAQPARPPWIGADQIGVSAVRGTVSA